MPSTASLLTGLALVALAGCGSAAAGNAPGGSAAANPARGGSAGQLVQVSGNRLTLSTANGDLAVAYSSATVITTSSTGSPADIVPGSCVVILGMKDSTGSITATTVRLSKAVAGACPAAGRPRGGGPGGSPRAFPSGGGRPSGAPTLNPNTAFVAGLVRAVTGTTISIQGATGTTTSVTIPTTLSVTESSTGSAADLTIDSCVRATGQRDSSGVVQATSLTVQPPNAAGSCTFGPGGGFGRGGFGGGAGGGGGAGAGGGGGG